MNCQFFVLAPGWVEWYVAGCTSTKVVLLMVFMIKIWMDKWINPTLGLWKKTISSFEKMKICSSVDIKRQQ